MADTRLPDTPAVKVTDMLAEAAATLRDLLPPGFAPRRSSPWAAGSTAWLRR